MKRVVFVTGESKSGKSYLATELANKHAFVPLSVDAAYVDYVREKCDELYFKALHKYIAPHYKHILSDREHSKTQFNGRDFVEEWHEYLFQQIEELATQKDRVVVEGYLLKYCTDCADHLREKLQGKVQIFQIQAANKVYRRIDQTLTVEQVATLGSNAPPEA